MKIDMTDKIKEMDKLDIDNFYSKVQVIITKYDTQLIVNNDKHSKKNNNIKYLRNRINQILGDKNG